MASTDQNELYLVLFEKLSFFKFVSSLRGWMWRSTGGKPVWLKNDHLNHSSFMIQNNTEIWEIRTENSRYTLLRNNRLWYLYFLLCHSKVSSLFFFSFCLFCLFSLRKDPQCRFIRQYWYIHLQNMCCGMGHHNVLESYLKKNTLRVPLQAAVFIFCTRFLKNISLFSRKILSLCMASI